MSQPSKKEILIVQLMLGISLFLGIFPPLIMYTVTRKKDTFYRESSRKALNFHLTIFPFFVLSYFFSPIYPMSIALAVLATELLFILNAMVRIALRKHHSYLIAIPFVKKERKEVQVPTCQKTNSQ
ncbi:DUF4870 domain-containing protein [Salicibibacter cibi]|uniref:DUF4870 domain-containing protein n=1 Tax=Salicibibacter cibi TaxID=2743001 RepID=A0A7T6ZDI2_9BACI|nr:DUF4870 domain-containing protein [Salicibibacter cibi]QQK81508.1 DUF4870 domain-containing protein [Salicibibacter cibi]